MLLSVATCIYVAYSRIAQIAYTCMCVFLNHHYFPCSIKFNVTSDRLITSMTLLYVLLIYGRLSRTAARNGL